jgi:RimJ/RimL family protein N-acetyltransferase
MDITLRLFREDDFDAFHAIVSDYDVVKMTSSWPFPADAAFTRMRINTPEAQAGLVKVIEVDGKLAGVVGIVNDEVGYHIGTEFWGRGVMTRALSMKITEFFEDPEKMLLKSCVWHDNPASARVLEKNGFQRMSVCKDFSKARNEEIEAIHYELSRVDWLESEGLK